MADRDGLFYRPNIKEPLRENEVPNLLPDIKNLDVSRADIPKSIIDSYMTRFQELEMYALELSERSSFLLDLVLEDMDGYIGDAPAAILQYIHELTGIDFTNPLTGELLPTSDPVYTLDSDTIKCIFRAANYYNDYSNDAELLDAVKNWDSAAFNKKVMKDVKNMGYLSSIMYGLKLLWMVVKICYVIMVHYTVGYQCAQFKRILGDFKVPKKVKFSKYKIKIKWFKLGKEVSEVFKKAEDKLLDIAGFSCEKDDDFSCDTEKWDEVRFRKITCCTTSPFFFNSSSAGKPLFSTTKCFEQWVNSELNNNQPQRYICDYNNKNKKDLKPTPQESSMAQAVTNYLLENPSKTGSLSRSDINSLKSSKAASDQAFMMSQNVQSSLNSMNTYNRTDSSGPWYNCFGYSPTNNQPSTGATQIQNLAQKKNNVTIIETGAYFQEYMAIVDDTLVEILKYADKIVSGTANLSKWASSKQLCCYIYLLVIIASLFHALISKGSICEEFDSENEDSLANAMRNELQYAQDLQKNDDVEKFVALLQLIKQIIDIFLRKMERGLFMQGFILPFGEMFEMIKLTLMNGLSSFLDILFGPLDMILVNLKAVPEIRHLINNNCFGFDKLMDFLSCSLGSIKYGILQEISKLINQFRMQDIPLIDDIYVSRARFEFLKALSDLLDLMIGVIFSLRDCYDSREVMDRIVERQQETMMTGVKSLGTLLGSKKRAEYLDKCAESLFGQNFLPDDERISELERDPSRLSSMFGEIGIVGDTIIQTDLFCSNCKSNFKLAEFFTEEGKVISPAEFMKKAEDFSDVKLADIQKDMVEIFDILRGKPANV